MKSDKGNEVIIVNGTIYIYIYMSSLYEIINNESTFLKLPSDPTIRRGGKLRRFLHILSKKGFSQ